MQEEKVHVITPEETEDKVRKLPMSQEEIRDWERWARVNFSRGNDADWKR